jgi:hypothetical protein
MRFESSRRRTALSFFLCISTLITIIFASDTQAASPDSAPPLPAPSGNVVRVSTEPELQAAVRNLASDTTILIAPGTYHLTNTLYVGLRSLTNVALRGATNRRDDVVLVGPGMTNGNFGNTPYGIWTGEGVQGILIANLTIRDFYSHPIILNAGTASPRIYNVRLADGGEQLVKSNPDPAAGKGIDNGIVEYSVLEYSDTSRDWYTNAVDVHGGTGWIIRHNLFRNIRAPFGQLAGPAILMWRGSHDTIVDGNTFVNCQREIAFGLDDIAGYEHTGGIIKNNFIYRDTWVSGDAGITLWDSASAQVLHNSILISGTYSNAIEYRFPDTAGVLIANNLVDGAIASRDGATATLVNNSTAATPALFVNPSAGDLHLAATATGAIDTAVPVAGAATDWDGEPRSQSAPDLGADEIAAPSVTPTGNASPDGTIVPPASQVVDDSGAAWTIGSRGAILRNAQPTNGFGSTIAWKNHTINVLGTDNNWWQWTSSGWVDVAPGTSSGVASSTSPDATEVPTNASQIIDSSGAVWTISGGVVILRNGVPAADGLGSKIVWINGVIYVLGVDNNWWQWTDLRWVTVGSSRPAGASSDGTIVPTNGNQIVDGSGAVWTIGESLTIQRNGTWAAGGLGSRILWASGAVYVLGVDGNWWLWTGSGWVNIGPTAP